MPRSRQDRELERLRRHRAEVELALRENLSLDAARARLSSYRAHLQRLAVDSAAAPEPREGGRHEFGCRPPAAPSQPYWWQRD